MDLTDINAQASISTMFYMYMNQCTVLCAHRNDLLCIGVRDFVVRRCRFFLFSHFIALHTFVGGVAVCSACSMHCCGRLALRIHIFPSHKYRICVCGELDPLDWNVDRNHRNISFE